jgi:hypothetical protein
MVAGQRKDPALMAEMQELIKLRVLDSSITAQEIPDVSRLPAFQRLAEASPFQFMQIAALYWDHARTLTTAREAVLRVAAYRYFLAHPNKRLLGASRREVVSRITDPHRRAAMLASDLFGDYGATSAFTGWARENALPFFSWKEVSARRYLNLFRNLKFVDANERAGILKALGLGGAAAGVRVGVTAAMLAVLVHAFIGLAALWNRLFWPDEEEELRKSFIGRVPHLIVGRTPDGQIRTVKVESGFADFLEWLGLGDYPADVRDVAQGRATVLEKGAEAVRAPLGQIVGSWEPATKTAAELLMGRSFFPDPFNPRPIRDRAQYLAQQYSVGRLYSEVMRIPTRPNEPVLGLLTQMTDPGEAAYFATRALAGKWKEQERGQPPYAGGEFTDKMNALYYYRQALKWGEPDKAQYWYRKYLEEGGTRAKARESIKRADPLGGLSAADRRAFLKGLSEEDRTMVDRAERWYRDALVLPARRLPGKTLPPADVLRGGM